MSGNVSMNPHLMLTEAHLWPTKPFGECFVFFLPLSGGVHGVNGTQLNVAVKFQAHLNIRKKNAAAVNIIDELLPYLCSSHGG